MCVCVRALSLSVYTHTHTHSYAYAYKRIYNNCERNYNWSTKYKRAAHILNNYELLLLLKLRQTLICYC